MNIDVKKIVHRCIVSAVSSVCAVSCAEFVEGHEGEDGGTPCAVSVKIDAGSVSGTRSFIGPDAENTVNTLCVFVFDSDGMPVKTFLEDISDGAVPELEFVVLSGSYRIYALANCGDLRDVVSRESHVREYLIGADDRGFRSAWMRDGIPMAGEAFFDAQAGAYSIGLVLERLAARYSFKVDFSGFTRGKIEVESVSLNQCAASLCPFDSGLFINAGIKMPVSSDGNDGASAADIELLNAGGEIVLYVPENLQGTDDGIKRQAEKIPSMMTEADPESCTYLEVRCRYSEIGLTSDDLTYRMYLGENAVSNFDIRRNASYSVTLCPKEESMRDDYWRCEATFDDVRTLGFSSKALLLRPADTEDETHLELFPEGLPYTGNFIGVAEEMNGDGIYGVSVSAEPDDVLKVSCSDEEGLSRLAKPYEYGIRVSTCDGEINAGIPLLLFPANVYWTDSSGGRTDRISLGYGQRAKVYCSYRFLKGYTGQVTETDCILPSGVSFTKTLTLADLDGWTTDEYEIFNGCTENITETISKSVVQEIIDGKWRGYLPEMSSALSVTITGSGFVPSARWLSSGSPAAEARVGDRMWLYVEDEASGEPYDLSAVSVPAEYAEFMRLAGYGNVRVKGKTVRAAEIEITGTDGTEMEIEAVDGAGLASSAFVEASYCPVTMTLSNSETGRWHLLVKTDNKNNIPFALKITAIGTGYVGTTATEANAPKPQIPGLRSKSSSYEYLGTFLRITHFYKDYTISETVPVGYTEGYDEGDGLVTYDVFGGTYESFMQGTLLDMDSFQYYRWLSPGQPAVFDTARLEIFALRFMVEIFIDPKYMVTLPAESFTFVDNLQPDRKWSAVYSGYYDDDGYGYKGIWLYVNGILMGNEPWEENYPL